MKKQVWSISKTEGMIRYSGKTFPCILYSTKQDTIMARDNNGKHPSAVITTDDVSLEGIKKYILPHISQPHPSDSEILEFLALVK